MAEIGKTIYFYILAETQEQPWLLLLFTMHTKSTMTDILQKVLYYVRQKQTACTLVVSSRHNIERYAFPVLYTAKKRSKEE